MLNIIQFVFFFNLSAIVEWEFSPCHFYVMTGHFYVMTDHFYVMTDHFLTLKCFHDKTPATHGNVCDLSSQVALEHSLYHDQQYYLVLSQVTQIFCKILCILFMVFFSCTTHYYL